MSKISKDWTPTEIQEEIKRLQKTIKLNKNRICTLSLMTGYNEELRQALMKHCINENTKIQNMIEALKKEL
jgi:hypothetical protein